MKSGFNFNSLATLIGVAGVFCSLSSQAGIYDSLMQCGKPGKEHIRGCLADYLAYQCVGLSLDWFDTNTDRLKACTDTIKPFLKELDPEQLKIDWVEDEKGFALHELAFSSLTPRLFMSDMGSFERVARNLKPIEGSVQPSLSDFFKSLDTEFSESYRFQKSHSLWDVVFERNDHDWAKTLQFMAVIFQDIAAKGNVDGSPTLFFPIYRMTKIKDLWLEGSRKEHLGQTIEAYVNLVGEWTRLKVREKKNDAYQFYPNILNRDDLSPMIHHFYVPAYLSLRLAQVQKNRTMAFFLPFLFNTVYEFKKMDEKLGDGRWPYRYPKAFDQGERYQKVEMNVRKIYTAYVGALYGLGLEKGALSYTDFSRRFSRNPEGFMKSAMGLQF